MNPIGVYFDRRTCLRSIIAGCTAYASPSAFSSEPWPTKSVRLIVPFPPGGGTDIVARLLGEKLADRLGQPVIVENKPGASTVIGADAVAKSPADGYTLLLSGSSTYVVNPALLSKLPYDSSRDLSVIAMVATVPTVLVVNAASPSRTLAELVAAIKLRPNAIRYATYGNGSGPHLTGVQFALAVGGQLQDVAYRGSAQVMLALLSGEIELAIDTVSAVLPHVRSGKLRALAVLTTKRSATLPSVPTMVELNYPDAAPSAWYAIAAPAHTPSAIVNRLARELSVVMNDGLLQSRLRESGLEPAFVQATQLRNQIDEEIARYRALAYRAKLKME